MYGEMIPVSKLTVSNSEAYSISSTVSRVFIYFCTILSTAVVYTDFAVLRVYGVQLIVDAIVLILGGFRWRGYVVLHTLPALGFAMTLASGSSTSRYGVSESLAVLWSLGEGYGTKNDKRVEYRAGVLHPPQGGTPKKCGSVVLLCRNARGESWWPTHS